MTTAKNDIFIGLELEDAYSVLGRWGRGVGILTFGGRSLLGGIFPGGGKGGGMSKFLAGWRTLHLSPSRENSDGWFWRGS